MQIEITVVEEWNVYINYFKPTASKSPVIPDIFIPFVIDSIIKVPSKVMMPIALTMAEKGQIRKLV